MTTVATCLPHMAPPAGALAFTNTTAINTTAITTTAEALLASTAQVRQG
jgi:hypothetical protein